MALCLLCAALVVAACGSDGQPSKAGSDAELAAEIRAKARLRQEERTTNERELQQRQTTTVSSGADSLPAGSAEIDGSSGASGGLLSAADRASFRRLAAQLAGSEGVAVAPVGIQTSVSGAGSLRTGVAWSTAKLPVAMAVISSSAASSQQANLRQAITASDNAAAEQLWTSLGEGAKAAAAATEQLRAAGDNHTQIQAQRLRAGYTAFGQTEWALDDQARFMAGIACTRAGSRVLSLMNQVVAGQRWGLGSTGLPAQFKGGWGPGASPGGNDGWLDRQTGIITIAGKPIAVAMATTAGDHGTGTQNLTAIARWVADHVNTSSAPRRATC